MPWIKGEFRWTTEEKLADLLAGVYGEELEDKSEELDDLVNAVRRDWTERLRKLRDEQYGPSTFKAERGAIDRVLNELDPDKES